MTSLESKPEVQDFKNRDVECSKVQNSLPRAISPFSTLLLPPAYKMSPLRVVGRRALSAPPFDRQYKRQTKCKPTSTQQEQPNMASTKSTNTSERTVSHNQTEERRAKSAVPVGKVINYFYSLTNTAKFIIS